MEERMEGEKDIEENIDYKAMLQYPSALIKH